MKFHLTIDQTEVVVDTQAKPLTEWGQPGSILDLALGQGIRINHSCGGVCSCTTCHVYVQAGLESCNPPGKAEQERLGEVLGRKANSRLACQCIPNGKQNVFVEIP